MSHHSSFYSKTPLHKQTFVEGISSNLLEMWFHLKETGTSLAKRVVSRLSIWKATVNHYSIFQKFKEHPYFKGFRTSTP